MILSIGVQAQTQTLEELKTMKAEKEVAITTLEGEIADLQKQIYTYPGWKIGGAGVVGLNLLGNNNWFALANPNSSNNNLGIGFSAFANNDQEKFFWRNLLNININRSAAFTDKNNNRTKTVALTNGLDLSSLFGYKLSPKWALSVEGKWLSSLLEFDPKDVNDDFDDEYNFALNSPGVMTISAGATWLPIENLVVIIHPLGYQKNFPGDFISSAGAKIGATYAATIIRGISWTSNLSAFIPYGGDGNVDFKNVAGDVVGTRTYESSDLVTWDWLNGFSFSVWKGVGVAFNLGLRGNRQIADSGRFLAIDNGISASEYNFDDNPVQVYYTLGLGYTF